MPNTPKAADIVATSPQPAQDAASRTFRTWAVTLGISATMLVTMYGLAFWHEARAEAARATPPAAISTPAH